MKELAPLFQPWTRRQAIYFLAGAIGTVTLNACTQSTRNDNAVSSDSSSLTPAAMGVNPWIGQAPLHIAQEKGFFREAGLDLEVRTFGANLEMIPAFSAGQLQGCTAMPSSEAVLMAAKGTDYRVIGVMDLSSGGDAILARNSIGDIQAFKGKQVAVQEGGLGHFFLLQVLQEAGLSGDDIKIVNISPDAAAAAYQAGNVEIAYTYSPFLEKANDAQPDGRIIYDTSKMPSAIIDLNIVSPEFAQNHADAVQAFLKGIFKAQEFLETNPDEAYAIVAKPLGIQPEEVGEQLKGVRLPDLQTHSEMLTNPQSDLYLLNSLSAMAEFLQAQGQIDTIPDLSGFIDPQFLSTLS
ncbi:aliphatic sulfonate ABC transporter substrate-binding protein [Oculatella sp. LEGE 06141]|uniref:aliphatic sulfonate ABC transporter substrate-binding protein n=1 Tax=Oculatella sp. LEGE 06141 TaxID=1828648 RepID=UPI0030DAFFD4